jgi:MOSC domain-containing protein YiiM
MELDRELAAYAPGRRRQEAETLMRWTQDDLRGTLRHLPEWWDLLAEGVDDPRVDALRVRAQRRCAALAGPADPAAVAAVEAALEHLSEAGRIVAGLGVVPPMTGTVDGVHVSDGGVPKLPVDEADVVCHGVVGDRQAARRHHGRPWQALCLWSTEVIASLAAQGHPIAPGRAGENITLAGLDWAALRPGVRLRIGTVAAELSLPTSPCKKNARWFAGGDVMQMSHDRYPGRSRWYARVVAPGHVRTGDHVRVESGDPGRVESGDPGRPGG